MIPEPRKARSIGTGRANGSTPGRNRGCDPCGVTARCPANPTQRFVVHTHFCRSTDMRRDVRTEYYATRNVDATNHAQCVVMYLASANKPSTCGNAATPLPSYVTQRIARLHRRPQVIRLRERSPDSSVMPPFAALQRRNALSAGECSCAGRGVIARLFAFRAVGEGVSSECRSTA